MKDKVIDRDLIINSVIVNLDLLKDTMPSEMELQKVAIDICIDSLKTALGKEKKVEYLKTKINLEDISIPNPVVLDPKAQDYVYCMFLSDYYKKKCEFIEAIERYGYACEKHDEIEKAEWFTKILGYHSELIDILMRGVLEEREHDDKT